MSPRASLHFPRACFRYAYQPTSDYGQIGAGSLRIVQLSHSERRTSGRYKQEALARNHQRASLTVIYNIGSFHITNTVSTHNKEPFGVILPTGWNIIASYLNIY